MILLNMMQKGLPYCPVVPKIPPLRNSQPCMEKHNQYTAVSYRINRAWRPHDMEKVSGLLALCDGNQISGVAGHLRRINAQKTS